jgi:hypothetical protein
VLRSNYLSVCGFILVGLLAKAVQLCSDKILQTRLPSIFQLDPPVLGAFGGLLVASLGLIASSGKACCSK